VNSERCTVTRLDQDLKVLTEIGGPGWGSGSFDRPLGIWARYGLDIYLADYGNHRIQRFDRTLSFVSQLFTRDNDNPDERFGYPTDVALSRMGALFICDSENGRILKLNRQNQVETTFGGIGGGKGRLLAPTRLEIGPADKVYVLDSPRIAIFDAFGNFLQELYLPIAGEPRDLFGTEEALLVLIDQIITCFNTAERPVGSLDLSTVQTLHGATVTAIAANRSRLFLLTEEELIVIPNPFPPMGSDKGSVERDGKND
jgi:DNA-binding beta-propeller fold protein YncE